MVFGLTQEQFMALTRQVLTIVGMLATTLGWASPEKVGMVTSWVLGIAGPGFVFASAIWSVVVNTQAATLSSAAKLVDSQGTPVTKKIEINPNAENARELTGLATPSNVVPATPGPGSH